MLSSVPSDSLRHHLHHRRLAQRLQDRPRRSALSQVNAYPQCRTILHHCEKLGRSPGHLDYQPVDVRHSHRYHNRQLLHHHPPTPSDGPPILRPILFIFEGGFLLSVFMYEHVKLGDLFEAYAQHIRRRRSHLAFFSRGIRFRERWYNRPLEDFRIFLTHAYDNQHCVVDVFTLPIDFDPDEDSEEDEVILTISGHDLMIDRISAVLSQRAIVQTELTSLCLVSNRTFSTLLFCLMSKQKCTILNIHTTFGRPPAIP
jgi:hypothetical protein